MTQPSTEPAPTAAQAVQGGPRGRAVARDMVLSLGLVALILLGWLWFAHPRSPEGIHTVPWYPAARSAAQVAPYEVLTPPASSAWSATSARVEPQPDGTIVWRVGFYTPAEDYAAILQRGVFPAQAQGSLDEWVAEETRDGVADGTVQLGDLDWTRMTGTPTPDERRSLVSTSEGTVTIVTGSAQWSELEQLASSLRPMPQAQASAAPAP